MTRLEIHVERLVLRGVPEEFAAGLGELVERRLTELATTGRRPDEPPPTRPDPRRGTAAAGGAVADRDALAALVADRIWTASREGGMPR
jgi:hypothetical protein